jgi:hypothetical protein
MNFWEEDNDWQALQKYYHYKEEESKLNKALSLREKNK